MKRISFPALVIIVSIIVTSSHAGAGELSDAVMSGNRQKVSQLLALGAPVNSRYENQNTPLHWAAAAGQKEMVRFLIEKGADVNAKNRNGWSPLNLAIVSDVYPDGLEVGSSQLDSDISIRGYEQSIRANRAAYTGDAAWLNIVTESEEKYFKTVQLLIENGADVNSLTIHNHAPLDLALLYSDTKTTSLLIEKGADVKAKGESNLQRAALAGRTKVVSEMIRKGVVVTPESLETTLLFAAGLGYVDIAGLLVDNGVSVNGGKESRTPLHWAVRAGRTETAILLIKKGADVNARDKDQSTPLHLAAANGNTGIAKLLTEKGADVNCRDKDAWTPLHWAAAAGKGEIAKLLIEKGADVYARDGLNWTPVETAEKNDHTDVAALIRSQKKGTGH